MSGTAHRQRGGSVPLSEDEERILHEIAQQFYADDPEFAREVGRDHAVHAHRAPDEVVGLRVRRRRRLPRGHALHELPARLRRLPRDAGLRAVLRAQPAQAGQGRARAGHPLHQGERASATPSAVHAAACASGSATPTRSSPDGRQPRSAAPHQLPLLLEVTARGERDASLPGRVVLAPAAQRASAGRTRGGSARRRDARAFAALPELLRRRERPRWRRPHSRRRRSTPRPRGSGPA